jgi:hypothetical protein
MEKNTNYLSRFKDDITEISRDNSLIEESVEEMIDKFFTSMKDIITDPRMPTVKITNFGTFKPSIGKINWQIRLALKYFRSGNITRERAVTKISHLWSIKQRLIKERLGEPTWNEWNKKNAKK